MATFAATYALVWLALAGYVAWMSSRQQRLMEQFARLQWPLSNAEKHEAEVPTSLRKVG